MRNSKIPFHNIIGTESTQAQFINKEYNGIIIINTIVKNILIRRSLRKFQEYIPSIYQATYSDAKSKG